MAGVESVIALQSSGEQLLQLVDKDNGLVDRRIFSDQGIYELELERIFARAWNFMAHDSQIPNPGDFFMNFIGEDRVIVVRDNDLQPQVLINSCRHRGNAVCRADEGHATSFMCTYHGWTYDLKGDLVGVPGFKEVYHEELDRENWGLIKAAKVDSHKGFIFACMDANAPTLSVFLGDVGRMCIDMIAARGEMQIVGGVQKYVIPCNWKFVADNSADWHHLDITHASSYMSRVSKGPRDNTPAGKNLTKPGLVWLGEFGHFFSALDIGAKIEKKMARNRKTRFDGHEAAAARQTLGKAFLTEGTPFMFPNFSTNLHSVQLRLPKSANETEIWLFTFLDKKLSPEKNFNRLQWTKRFSGPAGLIEQDDSENWDQSTRGATGIVSRRFPLHYGMGLGHGEYVEEDGVLPRLETKANEHTQRWFYRGWAEWMAAESWTDLKANHSSVLLR